MLKSAILFLDRGSQLDEEIVQQEEQAENINIIGKVQKNEASRMFVGKY